ncbi:MAG: bifunctional chorismate mutase/prephenate dehydratase, partial [Solirubrobacterales bacterium]|nr:bifunctional chorismate mutase/prephenate dehydratase [Solirubrobacterales bacterium]
MTAAGLPLRVAYQGVPGAYSEECAAALFPQATLSGERTFAAVFTALERGGADAALVPVENSTAGAVADVYDLLLGHEGLVVVGEAILGVRHCLLGLPGARLDDVHEARSHPQALAQSEEFLRVKGIAAREAYDTAGAARDVRDLGDPRVAAVASRRAATQLGLAVLAKDIQTTDDNSTRFFVLARRDDPG